MAIEDRKIEGGSLLPVYVAGAVSDIFGDINISGDVIVEPDMNVAEWGGTATSLGQKSQAASVPVTLDSTQDNHLQAIGDITDDPVSTPDENASLISYIKDMWKMMAGEGGYQPRVQVEDRDVIERLHVVNAQRTPTLSTSPAYANGDLLGVPMVSPISAPPNRKILSIVATINSTITPPTSIDMVFTGATALTGTYTNNAAPVITKADLQAIEGIIRIQASDFITISGKQVASLQNLELISNIGLMYFICNGTFAPTTVDELTFRIGYGI